MEMSMLFEKPMVAWTRRAEYMLQIIEEADLDGDERISFAEFEHVVSRSPDFIRTFHIRI